MKAYTTEDGHIVTFRPDLNAERLANSARRLEMPIFPEDRFVEAVVQTIKANEAYVPPYGSGATLYVRPYMFGSNPVIGVKPADEYQFRILTTPVGPYFKGGAKPITIRVTDFDRAAPHGTGHIKAGLNYAMSLHAIMDAHRQGYDENMYLDSATRTKVEETGGANFIFVTKDNTVVTPKSNSILPSITRRSLIYVAEHYLGLKVEEREVYLDEVKDFAECGLCGTAAVISPVGKIVDHGKEICFPSGMEEMGPTTKKLTRHLPESRWDASKLRKDGSKLSNNFYHSIQGVESAPHLVLLLLFTPFTAALSYLTLSYFTNVYSRSKYVCSSLSAVTFQSGISSRFGK